MQIITLLLLILTGSLYAATVQVTLQDGTQKSASLTEVTPKQSIFLDQNFGNTDIQNIAFETATPTADKKNQFELYLQNGSVLRSEHLDFKNGIWKSIFDNELNRTAVLGFRRILTKEQDLTLWNTKKENPQEDLLFTTNGNVLDFLEASLLDYSESEARILLKDEKESRTLKNTSKIFGFLTKKRTTPPYTGVLTTQNESEIFFNSLKIENETIFLSLSDSVTLRVPTTDALSIRFRSLSLLSLKPKVTHSSGLSDDQTLVEVTQEKSALFPVRKNICHDHAPLQLESHKHAVGLSIIPTTQVTYKLALKYSSLRFQLGINDSVIDSQAIGLKTLASCTVKLTVQYATPDKPELVQKFQLSPNDEKIKRSHWVQLDLKDAKTFILDVGLDELNEEDTPIQDYVIIGSPLLTPAEH